MGECVDLPVCLSVFMISVPGEVEAGSDTVVISLSTGRFSHRRDNLLVRSQLTCCSRAVGPQRLDSGPHYPFRAARLVWAQILG
jgi:hypothetical protein